MYVLSKCVCVCVAGTQLSISLLCFFWEVLMPRVVLIQQVETKFISNPIKEQISML